jgi:transposase InsO family protein
VTELFYGITQEDVKWVLTKCQICITNASNREPSTVTPIISRRCLDRVYIDLMDFTSQPDQGYNWVLQIKDHFSRMIWLFPLKDKSSTEVAAALRTFIAWCGRPRRFYSDNGGEFEGDVDDFAQNLIPVIPVIHGRPYHPQSQGTVEISNKTFKLRLAALRQEKSLPREWVSLLPELQDVTNTTSNRQLPGHMTPFEVWFGRKLHWISSNPLLPE